MNADRHEGPQWIVIGRLLRPQGRRGELLVEPGTDVSGTFASGRHVRVGPIGTTEALDTVIEESWQPTGRNAGRVVLKLGGIDSISDAEALAGRELLMPSTDLPALEADTWFVRDLVGCTLLDRETPVGQITGVEYTVGTDGRTRLPDAAPLLEVAPNAPGAPDEPLLVPFIKAWLQSVDLEQKTVRMNLPEGLLAFDSDAAPDS